MGAYRLARRLVFSQEADALDSPARQHKLQREWERNGRALAQREEQLPHPDQSLQRHLESAEGTAGRRRRTAQWLLQSQAAQLDHAARVLETIGGEAVVDGSSDPVVVTGGRSLAVSSTPQPTPPPLAELDCSGVGRKVLTNTTVSQCGGVALSPAQEAAFLVAQTAVENNASTVVLQAAETALLAAPGLNLTVLIPPTTPIPAGVNLSAVLPPATLQILLDYANVSSPANITTFGQIIDSNGRVAGGALNASSLLPLIPVDTFVALVTSVQCRSVSSVTSGCACPLEFRGERCESRRSLVVWFQPAQASLRSCLERPYSSSAAPFRMPTPGPLNPVGFAGSDLYGSGVSNGILVLLGAITRVPAADPELHPIRFDPQSRGGRPTDRASTPAVGNCVPSR
jgi:hypothetical protein